MKTLATLLLIADAMGRLGDADRTCEDDRRWQPIDPSANLEGGATYAPPPEPPIPPASPATAAFGGLDMSYEPEPQPAARVHTRPVDVEAKCEARRRRQAKRRARAKNARKARRKNR